nr:MAG TPA: hypothetical protein [Bacteriophage sp.]
MHTPRFTHKGYLLKIDIPSQLPPSAQPALFLNTLFI